LGMFSGKTNLTLRANLGGGNRPLKGRFPGSKHAPKRRLVVVKNRPGNKVNLQKCAVLSRFAREKTT